MLRPLSARISSLNNVLNRQHSAKRASSFALTYSKYGDPKEVIEQSETPYGAAAANVTGSNVLIKFLASPINPADLNTIQGVYPVKPMLPAVGGNEGVAEVLAVGSDAKTLKVGDWVIPAQSAFGTWQTHALSPENFFIKLNKDGLEITSAAQISVNPCTAYRMLKDFVPLEPGASVIQNGANSAVGINVIQIAREWKLKSINVIRSRPNKSDTDDLRQQLKDLGADYVVTEDELRDRDLMGSIFKNIPKPKLALNCVGGKNATDCIRHLDSEGIMVTYGGMSKQPLIVPTGALIFNDQRFKGYWMTRWNMHRSPTDPERQVMLADVCDLLRTKRLQSPKVLAFGLDDYKKALTAATSGDFLKGKPMFIISQ